MTAMARPLFPADPASTDTEATAPADLAALARIHWAENASMLLRSLVHHLGNPLQSVVLGAHGIVAASGLPRDHRLLVVLDNQVSRLTELTQTMQHLLRRRAAAPSLHPTSALLNEIVALQSHVRSDATVRVDLKLAEPLPEVHGLGTELRHALLNVVINAKEALAKAGEGEIRIAAVSGADGVTVTVEDDGPGIPVERYDWVFEPFTTTKEPPGGYGLGLPVARFLLEANGGALWVEPPHSGTGARFVIRLATQPRPAGLTLA